MSSALYLIIYPVMRFFLEFFRGDKERGIYFGLSTAQWISIAIFSSVILIIVFKEIKKAHKTKELDL